MAKVYMVRGSEDGVLGVFGSVTRAHARAVAYLTQNGEEAKTLLCQDVVKINGEYRLVDVDVAKKLTALRNGSEFIVTINLPDSTVCADIEALEVQ